MILICPHETLTLFTRRKHWNRLFTSIKNPWHFTTVSFCDLCYYLSIFCWWYPSSVCSALDTIIAILLTVGPFHRPFIDPSINIVSILSSLHSLLCGRHIWWEVAMWIHPAHQIFLKYFLNISQIFLKYFSIISLLRCRQTRCNVDPACSYKIHSHRV